MDTNFCVRPFDLGIFGFVVMALLTACGNSPAQQKIRPKHAEDAAQIRLSWYRKLVWPTEDCPIDPLYEDNPGIETYFLKENQTLVRVICTPGAYQRSSFLYWIHHGQAELLHFRQFRDDGIHRSKFYTDPLLTGIIEIDTRHYVIKVWRKYRGIGDCGQLLRYRLSDGETSLLELRVKECSDTPQPLPPEQWPKFPLSPP